MLEMWIRVKYQDTFPRPSVVRLKKRLRDAIADEVAGDTPYKLLVTVAASRSSSIGDWSCTDETVIFE